MMFNFKCGIIYGVKIELMFGASVSKMLYFPIEFPYSWIKNFVVLLVIDHSVGYQIGFGGSIKQLFKGCSVLSAPTQLRRVTIMLGY